MSYLARGQGTLGSVVQNLIASLQPQSATAPVGDEKNPKSENHGNRGDGKSLGPLVDGVEVLRSHGSDVVQLWVGGQEFAISRRTLSRIPGLERAISRAQIEPCSAPAAASATWSEQKRRLNRKDEEKDVERDRLILEGDSLIYEYVFAYARGNRSFLLTMDRRLRGMLRVEAQRLEMVDLVADIDWIVSPPADPEQIQRLEKTVSTMWSYLQIPVIHQYLMANGVYRLFYQYLQHQANQAQRSVEQEIVEIVRKFAQTEEFETLLRRATMPSIGTGSHVEVLPDRKPSLLTVYCEFVRDVAQYAAPIVGGQMLRNFVADQLHHYFHHQQQQQQPEHNPEAEHQRQENPFIDDLHRQQEDALLQAYQQQEFHPQEDPRRPQQQQQQPQNQPQNHPQPQRRGTNHPDPDHPKNAD